MLKKVLVTGSNGQLGMTIKELVSQQALNFQFIFASKSNLDITDSFALKQLFDEINFDFCINCAAYTNVEQAEITPEIAFKINSEAVKNLAQVCNENDTTLIHISTDYVFDGESNENYNEASPTNPINKYGESKLKGEQYIKDSLSNYYIIRTSWLYSKHGNNFLKNIIKKITSNSDLIITKSQTGTPSSCYDLTNFIFFLLQNNSKTPYGIYNFSALGETTWYHYTKHIAKHYNQYSSDKIKPSDEFKTKAKRPKHSVLNNTKVLKLNYKVNNWTESVDFIIQEFL